MRGWLTFLVKLVISAGLLALVLTRHPLSDVQAALQAPRWGWLAAAVAVFALSAWGGAVQWSWLLGAAGLRTAPGEIRRLYFIGMFFNNFLPANIGGDAFKIVDLGRRERCAGRVFCVTLLDRLLGLSGLTTGALVAAAVALALGVRLPRLALVLVAVLAGLLLVLAILVSRRVGSRVPRLLERLRLPTLARHTGTMVAEFAVFRRRLPWLGRIFVFGMGVQALRVLVHLLVAHGLKLHPDLTQSLQLMVVIPLLALLLTLPVTVNGIGLREKGAEGFVAGSAGLSATGAVAMELVAFLIVVLVSLVGGVLWWQRRGLGTAVAPASPDA
ncbi:MAG: lysylphosphatidylglycerol synthase transmembrane domain-containing protein [Candidatus Krumholzibacteriia bacterium]